MKKIVIIDDEPLARSIVLEYLNGHKDLAVVAECDNGYEGLKAIQQHKPDLVFLDIQMPKISGFEMLELLDTMPDVIFATAFDEYAIKAFEASAVDYLLKPFSKERFDTAIQKWKKRSDEPGKNEKAIHSLVNEQIKQPEEKSRIVVRTNSEISIIPVQDIHLIEAYDDYVKIFTRDTYFLKKKTMNYYESVLDPQQFFRCHRSFIINMNQLAKIEPMEKNSWVVLLRSGKKVPLSRTSYTKLKEKLGI